VVQCHDLSASDNRFNYLTNSDIPGGTGTCILSNAESKVHIEETREFLEGGGGP
jgi:hypothetical protein